jgi:hypothetical protein
MGLVSRLVVGPQDKKVESHEGKKKRSKKWIHLEEGKKMEFCFWTWGSTSPNYGFTK